jgi:hypothetical protein
MKASENWTGAAGQDDDQYLDRCSRAIQQQCGAGLSIPAARVLWKASLTAEGEQNKKVAGTDIDQTG